MAQFAALGIHAVKPFIDNSDALWEKGKDRIQKYRRRSTVKVYDDEPTSRPRGGKYAAAGGAGAGAYYAGRSRSTGDYYTDYDSDEDYNYRSRGRGSKNDSKRDYRDYDSADDSEGSIPPKGRRAQSTKSGNSNNARTRGGGAGWHSEGEKDNYSDDDDDESSSVLDSEEDERQEKKKRRREMLTGGIAAVATLHAAANVYGSMQARQTREKQLAEGTITREQAKRQRYKHHMQDAASIGLAALSIKGAYGKWQGTHAKHKEVKDHRKEREERHQKRLTKGISRSNQSSNGGPSNGRGLPAPNGDSYNNNNNNNNNGNGNGYGGGAVATRPVYNRGYSRSLNDLSRDYGYSKSNRSDGKARRRYYNDYDGGNGDYDGYDVGHA